MRPFLFCYFPLLHLQVIKDDPTIMDHIYKLVNVSKSRDETINEILAYLLTVEKSRTELNRSRRGAPADEVAENDAVELELKRL